MEWTQCTSMEFQHFKPGISPSRSWRWWRGLVLPHVFFAWLQGSRQGRQGAFWARIWRSQGRERRGVWSQAVSTCGTGHAHWPCRSIGRPFRSQGCLCNYEAIPKEGFDENFDRSWRSEASGNCGRNAVGQSEIWHAPVSVVCTQGSIACLAIANHFLVVHPLCNYVHVHLMPICIIFRVCSVIFLCIIILCCMDEFYCFLYFLDICWILIAVG